MSDDAGVLHVSVAQIDLGGDAPRHAGEHIHHALWGQPGGCIGNDGRNRGQDDDVVKTSGLKPFHSRFVRFLVDGIQADKLNASFSSIFAEGFFDILQAQITDIGANDDAGTIGLLDCSLHVHPTHRSCATDEP